MFDAVQPALNYNWGFKRVKVGFCKVIWDYSWVYLLMCNHVSTVLYPLFHLKDVSSAFDRKVNSFGSFFFVWGLRWRCDRVEKMPSDERVTWLWLCSMCLFVAASSNCQLDIWPFDLLNVVDLVIFIGLIIKSQINTLYNQHRDLFL